MNRVFENLCHFFKSEGAVFFIKSSYRIPNDDIFNVLVTATHRNLCACRKALIPYPAVDLITPIDKCVFPGDQRIDTDHDCRR